MIRDKQNKKKIDKVYLSNNRVRFRITVDVESKAAIVT